MSCNSCAKPFTLLRKEKGCPGCGFSYCSKCLNNKVFVQKLNSEAKVCAKCKRESSIIKPKSIEPPDAYYKRLGLEPVPTTSAQPKTPAQQDPKTAEIQNRLQKLKEDKKNTAGMSDDAIANRLQKLKGDIPKATDEELQERLARLRGVPVNIQTQPVLPAPDLRTEQEQADDLLKQYMEQNKVDSKYKDEFNSLINDIEARLGNLKGSEVSAEQVKPAEDESEDEDSTVQRIVEKIKAEASLDPDELPPSSNDELPFCEICNEDAVMRCLGCHYLFCKRCFMEHRDDDDGCNRYEPYKPPINE